MKKIIIYTFIILIFNQVISQERFPQRVVTLQETSDLNFDIKLGDYIKDTQNKTNDYIGDWVYNDGNETIVTFRLRRKDEFLCNLRNYYFFYDGLILTYKLVKNNVTIFDNLNAVMPDILPASHLERPGIGNLSVDRFDNNVIAGNFSDYTYNQSVHCSMKKIPVSSGQQPKLSLYLYGAFWYNDKSFYANLSAPFSIPNNIVLTKL